MKYIIIVLIFFSLDIAFLSAQNGADLAIDLPTFITGNNKFIIASNLIKPCEAATGNDGDNCAPPWTVGQFRKVIYFGTKTNNISSVDYVVGAPNVSVCPQGFEYDICHRHHHTKGFLEFRLFTFNSCNNVTNPNMRGKSGTCLGDGIIPTSGPDSGKCENGFHANFPCRDLVCADRCTTCNTNQGLSAGCSDTYGYDIDNGYSYGAADCQYLYIDSLPNGRYIMRVRINTNYAVKDSNSNCPNLRELDDTQQNPNLSVYNNNVAYYIFDMQGSATPAPNFPSNFTIPHLPDTNCSPNPNYAYVDSIYPHRQLYISHTIPETLDIGNIVNQLYDNSTYPSNLNVMAIARKVIETGYNVGGGVILNDNKDREMVAGESIRLGPGTTISSAGGGRTHIYINSCLATANYKTSRGEGLFVEEEIASVATLPRNDAGVGKGLSFEVKPNPFTKGFRITYTISDVIASQARNDVGFRMVNMLGVEVWRGVGDGSGVLEVTGAGFPAGIYNLMMETGSNRETKRVVKVE